MDITSFLNSQGFFTFEGYSQQIPEQVQDLITLTNKSPIKVMEIGFNAGHSADLFLRHNENLTLISFDIGTHPYVAVAKSYIDRHYPHRHLLIIGDSRTSIPTFIQQNKDTTFDIIFIDGGHEYEIVQSDMKNCIALAHKDTILILDDTIYTPGWERCYTIGPTQIWMEYQEQQKIVEWERKEYCEGRGMSWGRYLL